MNVSQSEAASVERKQEEILQWAKGSKGSGASPRTRKGSFFAETRGNKQRKRREQIFLRWMEVIMVWVL